jgi:two-component system, response regulator YesN
VHLIIVDDESILVEELETTVEWEELGITKVFTAHNMNQAKHIFSNSHVDIMLCDIEMPQGTGLDLLTWVKNHSPKTETIFLTCHAEFSYAKEAIRLGSMDYLLKPVPTDELKKIVLKAANRIQENSQLLEYRRYGEFWFKHQPIVIERFWIDILNRSIPTNKKSIKIEAELRNIPYEEEMKFLPLLVSIRRWHGRMDIQELKIIEFGIKNIISEVVLKEGSKGQIIELDKGKIGVILSMWNNPDLSLNEIKNNMQTCIQTCNRHLLCDVTGYIGNEAFAHELPMMVDGLMEQERNNVTHDNEVLNWEEQKDNLAPQHNLPDMDTWSIMLAEGSCNKLIDEITSYLEKKARTKNFDANTLKYFQHDFIQMVYSTLKNKGIQAHQLLNDYDAIRLYDQSEKSILDLMEWIKYTINSAFQYEYQMEQSQSIVEKVKKIVELNMWNEITREDIANQCYLHPDYLDRIFKKKTGYSVSKFLVHERLTKAKELLEKTDLSISTIAVTVGYKNMSHFSTTFKKFTNFNPNDYRTHFQEKVIRAT